MYNQVVHDNPAAELFFSKMMNEADAEQKAQQHFDQSTNFAIIASPRTASTSLSRYLQSKGVGLAIEPFHPSSMGHTAPVQATIMRVFSRMAGFKHVATHIDVVRNQDLIQTLIDMNVPVLHMRRENKLAQALSVALSLQTGIWHVDDGNHTHWDTAELDPIDPEQVKAIIENIVVNERGCLQLLEEYPNANFFEYGIFFKLTDAEKAEELARILEHFGIPPWVVENDPALNIYFGSGRKQNTLEKLERIPNLDEILSAFPGANLDE